MTQMIHYYNASVPFPGNIYTEFAFLNGPLQVNGAIHANTLDLYGNLNASSINVQGYMTTTNASILAQHVGISYNPRFNLDGYLEMVASTLTTPTLFAGMNSSLGIYESTVQANVHLTNSSMLEVLHALFEGSIYSEGVVRLARNRTLSIIGNYTQGPQGVLEIRDLDLANRTSGYVNATGPVQINGKITYSILYPPRSDHEVQMLVVLAPAGVTGQFSGKANFGLIQQDSELEYASHSVNLIFNTKKGDDGGKGSLWWIWLVIGVALVAVVGLIVLLYVTRHRRKGFREVPMS